jgi:hypothetical protein
MTTRIPDYSADDITALEAVAASTHVLAEAASSLADLARALGLPSGGRPQPARPLPQPRPQPAQPRTPDDVNGFNSSDLEPARRHVCARDC